MANSIKVTFKWYEHAPGAPESQWQRHQVERMVPLRKGRVAQGRVIEKRFLELMAKRVTETTDVDGQYAYWTSFHWRRHQVRYQPHIEYTNAVWW